MELIDLMYKLLSIYSVIDIEVFYLLSIGSAYFCSWDRLEFSVHKAFV